MRKYFKFILLNLVIKQTFSLREDVSRNGHELSAKKDGFKHGNLKPPDGRDKMDEEITNDIYRQKRGTV